MRARPLLAALALSILLPASAQAVEFDPDDAETGAPVADYVSETQHLVNQAMSYLGIRYRFGGTSPETGLDCSGLVQNVFRNAVGLDLPRTAREMASLGNRVTRRDLQPGDLVFFNTMRRTFSHVGIYLGDGQFVHAPAKGGSVRVESMQTSYWTQRFSGARRLVSDEAPSTENLATR
ncbi:NlpC/P60 family protein [Pseudothauera nasutitermitis]|uniref:NlpC/P60 family protein n=1 Tax=Pseudothauera nasutitermitis TaxID=2565930 RepID=A0A4S4B332_9RHOO|nr:C40 family peptidase [Pseudothauera nasutitermitis]THF66989.1 NlpC/P60 family protein [Pseudothauera nasutitermitis]